MKIKPMLFTLIAAQAAAMLVTPVQAATDPNDVYAVKVVATVTGTSPWQITLSWPSHSGATYEVRRKTTSASSWGSTVSGGSTGYADSSSLSTGVTYEYEVKKSFNSTETGYGYASVSLGASAVEGRGKVILIVDNTKASSLTTQLADFTEDLIGDGWSVVRHDVAPDDPSNRAARVAAVKNLIQAEYNADSTVKAVFLIGHIPVPYSGVFDVSGHSDSQGAYPADAGAPPFGLSAGQCMAVQSPSLIRFRAAGLLMVSRSMRPGRASDLAGINKDTIVRSAGTRGKRRQTT